MDDFRSLDDEPQGGPDVQSWRTPNGIGHRFDDDTSAHVDCMACIAAGSQ